MRNKNARTNNSCCSIAQRDGQLWGVILAPIVDLFFGKDHCKNNIGE